MAKKETLPFIQKDADKLLRDLVKEGENIPRKQLEQAIGSDDPQERNLMDRARKLRKIRERDDKANK
jgi:hypothetical protein